MITVFKKMSKAEAERWAADIDNMSDPVFSDLLATWEKREVQELPEDYVTLRKLLVSTFDTTISENTEVQKNRLGYLIDLNVGFAVYEFLSNEEKFTTIHANDDDVWRYISCAVIPDITYERYPNAAQGDLRINSKRFFAHTRRIWIKTLWWYIHLSWQGDRNSTFEILKDFGTDTISDFIERPGRGKGYRIPLFRAMVNGYSRVDNKSADLFNSISKLNLVKCKTLEPALTQNKEHGYIEELLQEILVGRGGKI